MAALERRKKQSGQFWRRTDQLFSTQRSKKLILSRNPKGFPQIGFGTADA
jgi:hypothetical protein